MLRNQQIANFQTASKPEYVDDQVVLVVSDIHFVCFRGHFISLFWVSVYENALKHILDLEVNTLFMFFFVEKNYAHIWQSLDGMQMYILHIECDDTENIATKGKVIQSDCY